MRLRLLVLLAAAALLLPAKTKPAPRPRVDLPAQYSRPLGDAVPLTNWWQSFEDPYLSQLVARAIERSPDLAVAQARLLEARANTQSSKAGLWPSASASLAYTNSQRSNNSPAIPRFETPPGAGPSADLIPRRYALFDASFDVSYEFDWYGANRKNLSAQRLDQQAEEESLRDTRVSLLAELARSYFDLREAENRLMLGQQQVASFRQSLEILELRRRNGLANPMEEARLKAQMESTQAGIPTMQARIEECLLAIGALTGASSGTLLAELGVKVGEPQRLPQLPAQIPGGLPADLLKRRPDIRRAYAQLEAATARRQSAYSDWFPKLKLTASNGGQSGELTNLLSGSSIISNFAPKLSWGALNYRQTQAKIRQREANEAQQLAAVEKSVALAFRDVETALTNYTREGERQSSLSRALQAQQELEELQQQRYRAGLENLLPSLEAERSVLSAREAELQSQANRCRQLLSLYKALGGGW
jgi:NodT family efflux transporter outer membrane factor (OMF) lipoprotein